MAARHTKTQLVQKRIGDPASALVEFQRGGENVVPLVLVPDDRCCCSCLLTVPSGPYCIMHRFGKEVHEKELAPAGLQCALACNRIAYCVTQQACTYNAPVKSCPTADNVMVDCDLTLIFRIGPNPIDVKKFVYTLGARRFDEFLYAAVEEGIRHLVRSCLHTEVYELRGNSDPRVQKTLKGLNSKFNKFGVDFQSCAITDVRFKPELQEILQQTTEFKSKIVEQTKKQKNEMDKIQFQQSREMEELAQQNARVIQDLQAQRARLEIMRQKQKVDSEATGDVKTTKIKQAATVNLTRATAEKKVAKAQGDTKAREMVADANTKAEGARIRVVQETKTLIYESTARLEAVRSQVEALKTEADAEEKASVPLKLTREHELRMAKMEVLQSIAANSSIVIGGEAGDRLISTMLDESILGRITLPDSR